jgi:hypothetical protein
MNISKTLSVSYLSDAFSHVESVEKEKGFFLHMKERFEEKIKKWKDFRPLRSRIEDVFKLLKSGGYREKIHRYTEKSCQRFVICSTFLARAIIYAGFRSKTRFRVLAES